MQAAEIMRRGRLGLAAVGLVVLLSGADLLACALFAAIGAAFAYRPRRRVAPPPLDGELQRQLLRSRRREEPATVLVARGASMTAGGVEALLGTLRSTDAHEICCEPAGIELRAVLEGGEIDRGAIEARLTAAAEPAGLALGWATFPTDGLTLEALLEAARGSLWMRAQGGAHARDGSNPRAELDGSRERRMVQTRL